MPSFEPWVFAIDYYFITIMCVIHLLTNVVPLIAHTIYIHLIRNVDIIYNI